MSAGPSLSYILAHPTALGITVLRPAALFVLLCVPLLRALAPPSAGLPRTAVRLRLAAFVLVVFALAGVTLTARVPNERLSLIVAVDVSESVGSDGRQWAQRYLDRAAASLAPGDEFGVVAFAQGAAVVLPPGPPRAFTLSATTLPRTATDIGRGLETAMALFPADTAHRLLLISDGNETRGDSLATVARARQSAIAISATVPPHSRGADVAMEKFIVAPLVTDDQVVPLRAVLRNHGPRRTATVNLLVDGALADSQPVTLQRGTNAIDVPYRLSGSGGHRLRLEVAAADDPIAGNNYRERSVTVSGKASVLLISGAAHSPLASALLRKSFQVKAIPPGDFPARLDQLAGYHCAIFEDVRADAFSARQLDALERYVRDVGGGFIMAGGARTYLDSGFVDTALERLLPVTLERRPPAQPEPDSLALFLLIDRSNSMGYQIHSQLTWSADESKLAYAKRAALAVVRQLRDSDRAGVIAFDSQAYQVAPFRVLADTRALLEKDIPRLQPGGGTDFHDALESARVQLSAAPTASRHVILLTDGATIREPAAHNVLIAAMAKAHISVTTIRIGSDRVDLNLLRDIAARTGGRFYHVEDAAALPDLVVRDLGQATAQPAVHEPTFTPRVTAPSQLLRGLHTEAFPGIRGYAHAHRKHGADTVLDVGGNENREPLLAAWQYGLGRVIAFTASPTDDADTWVGWEGFGKFWSQLGHWVARDETPWDYAVEVHRTDGQATLTIRSFADLDGGLILARVFSDADHATDVALTPRAPREFTGRLPNLAGGRYPLTITRRRGTAEVSQQAQTVTVPDTDDAPQEEYERDRPNLALLHALASATGGTIDPSLRALTERPLGKKRALQPLDWLFVPTAMLLFLADVGFRRLRHAADPPPRTESSRARTP